MTSSFSLEEWLPVDLVDDIMRRVHRLRMAAVLDGVRDPERILASFPPKSTDDWMEFVDGDVQCLTVNATSIKHRWLYMYFTREVQKVIHVTPDYFVGRMDWGAWFFHRHGGPSSPLCVLAEDANSFVRWLPREVRRELSLDDQRAVATKTPPNAQSTTPTTAIDEEYTTLFPNDS